MVAVLLEFALMDQSDATDALYKERSVVWLHIQLFLLKLLYAALQITGMTFLVVLHWGLDYIADFLMHDQIEHALKLVDAMLVLAFIVISLQLVYDMVVLFVPWLRQHRRWNRDAS